MRGITFAGIILVAFVVVAVNLLAEPQTLDASQMQTMYGGVCYSKSDVATPGCSPTWTCSSSKSQGGTDHTDLKTQQLNYVTSGSKSYSSRKKDTICKITPFRPKGGRYKTCSQRKLTSTYKKGPKYSFNGSCSSGSGSGGG